MSKVSCASLLCPRMHMCAPCLVILHAAGARTACLVILHAELVQDAIALAKEKSPCIIFIDEIDAIGTKRFDSEVSGDREVQRTMLELLNQLDGFSSDDNIKVRDFSKRSCDCVDSCNGHACHFRSVTLPGRTGAHAKILPPTHAA